MRRVLLLALAISFLQAGPPPPPIFPPDLRPFGKYLVLTCTVRGICNEGLPRMDRRTPQTITMKQVGCAPGVNPCPDPVYPLSSSHDFFISAVSDSGLNVSQRVISGRVTPIRGGGGVQQYHLSGPGKVVIEATQGGNGAYSPAQPVQIVLDAPADAPSDDGTCSGLFSAPEAVQAPQRIDAASVVALIGNPTPFQVSVQGDLIFIYSLRAPPNKYDELLTLGRIIIQIQSLAHQTPARVGTTAPGKPFQVELDIQHALSLGDPAARIAGLNYSAFTVADIGNDKVRITSPKPPDCATWTAFLSGIRRLEWQGTPEPFQMKLFYLSAPDAVAAFSALAPPATAGPAASPTPAPAPSPAPATAASSTIAVNQPPGSFIDIKSDTTPCVIAGLTISNSSACSGSSSSAASASSSSAASPAASIAASPPKPIGMASMNVATGASEQSQSDILVFSTANLGDDAQILERKRILAQLDLPRPQMIVNAWVMQNSTSNPTAMGKFTSTVRNLVTEYNNAIAGIELAGLEFVRKAEKTQPDYFDRMFYHYISDQFVSNNYSDSKAKTPQEAAQKFLDRSSAKLADSPDTLTTQFGVCAPNHYCLGYNNLFHPVKPHLTDFLLNILAAAQPRLQMSNVIGQVQGIENPVVSIEGCFVPGMALELQQRCRAVWRNLGLDRTSGRASCAETDQQDILYSLLNPPPGGYTAAPRIYLICLQQAADFYLPRTASLVRASIADFLFHYKLSQQYPHDFLPYELSQSADSLNSALAPLIDAFNRDIVAYQTFMRADLQYQVERLNRDNDQRCCAKRLFGLDKPSFFNDGLVTVRTISGQPTSVSATSQSAIDASSAPSLANLANSILSPPSATGTSPAASLLNSSQSSAALIQGILNAYQATTAQIGRSLTLNVTPRSLTTASSAEINVTLAADESSSGVLYSGGPQGATQPNTSRVANHDTSTRIRVESVRMFELSSFSAIVERSRSKFPLLPPFVEIPYIGTIAGIPIPAAKEYHSSTAVMSAMVVPTAADIAYGLTFSFDLLVSGTDGKGNTCSYITGSVGADVTPCNFRRANSLRDFHQTPIFKYHSYMINCLATEPQEPAVDPSTLGPGLSPQLLTNPPFTPYSGFANVSAPAGSCDPSSLTFDRVPH